MKNYIKVLMLTMLFTPIIPMQAQNTSSQPKDMRLKLNDDGTHYIKLTFVNQVWLRYTEMNPGSTVFGEKQGDMFDIGIRRTRMQVFGQLTDKVFFYTQFGQNNFNYLSKQFAGSFIHDAAIEYQLHPQNISLGAGLAGWSGLSRYASPAVGQILSLDAPLYQQATNGVNDQFLRKLSFYAKGKLGKLDYRVALSKPMAVQNAVATVNPISDASDFSMRLPKLQTQGYFMYQFLDQESNTTPYTCGTYLGSKRVFNIGAGFIYQPDAMWRKNIAGDTLSSPMQLLAADVFYDAPLNKEKGTAITLYAAYHYYDFGKNYVRNLGVMNPANGTNAQGTYNGSGNAFPMLGSGQVYYAQAGYLLKKDLLPNHGTLQPYAAAQLAEYKRLADPMLMYEFGCNWLIHGSHASKISLNYQGRPVYELKPDTRIEATKRKGMIQLQYQVAL